jgi:phosphoribosylaminoimidazolecarboxamide formyltransferase/IMP cyclohydrolase
MTDSTTDGTDRLPIRRALVSVWDKAGLGDLAGAMHAAGVEIVSTGSTAAAIAQLGLPVTPVEQVTGARELLDGRVKTLHPRIHAGLLADRRNPEHVAQLEADGIAPFDLVVVNLYPFEAAAADPAAPPDEVIERIDVGGPSMIRAAAKNHACLAVVCDPADYHLVGTALAAGGTTAGERRALAARAFARTAAYDRAIADWFAGARPLAAADGALPGRLEVAAERLQALRYGENPHQAAAFYRLDAPGSRPWGLAAATQVAGKELSYNNLLDADAAVAIVRELPDQNFVTIVKHTNPCGAAVADTLEEAYVRALSGDPDAAFGGIVGLSKPLDAATAERIRAIFTEVVVAPAITPEARQVLAAKPSLRLVEVDLTVPAGWVTLRSVAGGLLAQEADQVAPDPSAWKLAAGPAPAGLEADLELAWRLVKHLKSNAIALVREGRLVGAGAGQMSRVESSRLAVAKAGKRADGAVAASDAFFPFPDGLQVLADAGVRAVIQPGGSVRDAEVAEAAEAAGVALILTGRRHFRH